MSKYFYGTLLLHKERPALKATIGLSHICDKLILVPLLPLIKKLAIFLKI